MSAFTFKSYTLQISFDSSLKFYEGNSLEGGFYSRHKNLESLKQQFREHIRLRHKRSKIKRPHCNIVDVV